MIALLARLPSCPPTDAAAELGVTSPFVETARAPRCSVLSCASCAAGGSAPGCLLTRGRRGYRSYTSIPQRNKGLQALSIRSLPLYASSATYFLAIAPRAEVALNGAKRSFDEESYRCECEVMKSRIGADRLPDFAPRLPAAL